MANDVKKILLVEDEPDAREIYLDILKGENMDAVGVGDGTEALVELEKEKYSLILLDIIMPKMDGVETLGRIKQSPDKYGTPKVVMLSNIGGDIAIDKAMELGADGYMLKSETEPEDFVNVVKKYLE
ncbi:response regulator [Candidatus Dojkabacteria bacterium]|nr:response regulator [Candidatus Dojkabacteria bacterium]